MWLAPEQVSILPVSEKYLDYAKSVAAYLDKLNIRATIDERNEKIGRKIRDTEIKKVSYMLIVGEKEMTENSVNVRRHGGIDLGEMSLDSFAKMITEQVEKEQNV